MSSCLRVRAMHGFGAGGRQCKACRRVGGGTPAGGQAPLRLTSTPTRVFSHTPTHLNPGRRCRKA